MDRFLKTKKFCVKKDEGYHVGQQKEHFGKTNLDQNILLYTDGKKDATYERSKI